MRHPENRLWELLALKLSGEATEAELLELNAYLKKSPDEQNIINSIEAYWNQESGLLNNQDETEEQRFHLILHSEDQRELKNDFDEKTPIIKLKQNNYKWFSIAASAIIIIGLGFLIMKHSELELIPNSNSNSKTVTRQVIVKPGSKSKVILPDGTVVRLNGSSRLSYGNNFNEKIREVELEGEAYFDVTKDADHPFIVHTSNIDIKVLGTLFNVKSYEQDSNIETTLLRGVIEVYNKNDPSALKVILKPNEKLVFAKNRLDKIPDQNKNPKNLSDTTVRAENISITTLPVNKPDSLKEETSWLYNKLVIDGDDFKKMAEKMERWYGVRIEIISPELEQYHFKGIFENETIEQALKALQLTVEFRYEINNNIIKIMK